MSWKQDFSAGERFRIKDHIFEISHIGKRALILRKISVKSETETENQNSSDTDAEQKESQQ